MKIKSAVSFFILMFLSFQSSSAEDHQVYKNMQVGVILDMDSWVGKTIYSCITMAISDFYAANPQYRTRIILQKKDTRGDPLRALSAGIDLLENTKVDAIIGPESTVDPKFLEVLGENANVPILSFSTIPSSNQNPYFLRIAQDENTQFKGIAAMVGSFKWKNVILICEDDAKGREMATYMVNAFQEKSIQVTYTSLVSSSTSDEQVTEGLQKLLTMQPTTFVVHTSPSLAFKIFLNAKMLGIMGEGYAWIVTSMTANMLDFRDAEAVESMQGVVGFKSYIPASMKLRKFISKLRNKYYAMKPFMQFKEPDFNGILAYDTLCALAMAFERVQTVIPQEEKQVTELASRQSGAALLKQMLRINFHGLGGEFTFKNGSIISNVVEMINVIGKGDRTVGFWTVSGKFTKEIGKTNLSTTSGLKTILWPGGTTTAPKHRRLLMSSKKLRILVPDKPGFRNLVQLTIDPKTNQSTVSGLCGDVFNAALNALDYDAEVDITPIYFGGTDRTYDELISKVYLKEFDAFIGDVTITANRSLYVDFTLPITDQGVATLVRNAKKSMWIFLDPLSIGLWVLSASFFLVLGFVIWFIEHRTNAEFQGSVGQQIGTSLWFAFSTLVYAHRAKLQSNLSRFVVTIWVFVVLVLTSSYTATLSSLLTIQQIASKERSIRFQNLSPVGGAVFKNLKYVDTKIEKLYTEEDYARVLTRGSVRAIIAEIPYVKTVLAMYSTVNFSMIVTSSNTNGLGFAFQKGSTLATEMSTQIAKMREDGTLKALEDKWLDMDFGLTSKELAPKILNLDGFRGLFVISGVSMGLAVLVSMVYLVREKWHLKIRMYIMRSILQRFTQEEAPVHGDVQLSH